MKLLLPALAGAMVLAVQPAPASAAPSLAGGSPLAAGVRAESLVQKTVFQCWVHRGVRRCRWVQGVPRPEAYRTGSPEWWRAMEDWGRTGGFRR
jgi:hypothetical protein